MNWHPIVQAPHIVLALRRSTSADPAPPTAIAQDKLAAYLGTHYEVRAPEPITLCIGIANAPLAAAMARHESPTCAFLTAYNPFGQTIPDEENRARHEAMVADLKRLGCRYYEGAGWHPDNGWPEELSCLCFGVSFDVACDLGAKWGQDAIVWSSADAVPVLVLLR